MRLGVNIDHIATVRQARRGAVPDPVEAALTCERAGADGIVCHLREDRRHIQDADVRRLRRAITTRFNLEMSIAPSVVRVALAVKPDQVTLVPERRQELTTEGGLDVAKLLPALRPLIRRFQARGIAVSLFIDPIERQLAAARKSGAGVIELHTGRYANARDRARAPSAAGWATGVPSAARLTATPARARELEALQRAARRGRALGLAVAAGHGLDYANAAAVAKIPEIEELNIGFSIIAHALSVGLETAVREMVTLMQREEAHAVSA
ncbi:MAG: pyridoxine 5'-phosphate synthase [Candidatus Omnitrophica bacterium]|nr:pyridoxine 5'-phosphate synthase [Candidatus Omnitrophota bacterium]